MLFDILINIITPIFLLIAVGFVVNKAIKLDIRTLSRLMFNVYSPAVVFSVLYNSELNASDLLNVIIFSVIYQVIMLGIGWGTFSLPALRDKRTPMTLGAAAFNGANYGFPLMLLAFGDYAIGIVAGLILPQIVITFTVGIIMMDSKSDTLLKGMLRILKVPVMYAIIFGLLARGFQLSIPQPLAIPLGRIVDGYVAAALITLGAQLAETQFSKDVPKVLVGVVMRNIVGAAVAVGLVYLLHVEDPIAPVLILAGGLPVAVNIYILSAEFDSDPEFASLLVFLSTLSTLITIPLLLILIRSL